MELVVIITTVLLVNHQYMKLLMKYSVMKHSSFFTRQVGASV